MKIKLFLLSILLLPVTLKAQKNCVEIKNSITGKINKIGAIQMFSANSSVLNFIKQGDDYTVNYITLLSKPEHLFISDSLHVLFEFGNGVKRDISASKLSHINGDSTAVTMYVAFISNKITNYIDDFKKNRIVSITLGSDSNYTMENKLLIPEGLAERILDTVNCVAE